MRRWELVADGSAKFWEIGREGSSVVVRFGRLRTNGQSQTKEFPSVGHAEAHVARLVAEKEKKGYRIVGAAEVLHVGVSSPAIESTPDPSRNEGTSADEDMWAMPRAWLREVVRQRGIDPAPEFSVDVAKAAVSRKLVVEQAEVIEQALSSEDSVPEVVGAAREHLAGRPDPVGAAAVEAVTKSGVPAVHAWIADHGLAFAAAAVVERMTLVFDRRWTGDGGKWTDTHLQHSRSRRPEGVNDPELKMLTSIRYAIAVSDDESRAAAEAALERLGTTSERRELRSYLAPGRTDWFSEVRGETGMWTRWWMLVNSAGSLEDYRTFGSWLNEAATTLYTAVHVVGPALAPLLAEILDRHPELQDRDERTRVLKVLAAFPTDEAFTILLDRIDAKYVRPALLFAMAAFPVRAARLLAERVSSNDEVPALLSAHLRSNPSLEVSAEATAVLAETWADDVPEASAAELPPLLASPPWLNRRPQARPVVLTGLPVPPGSARWEVGEHEQWLEAGTEWRSDHLDWKKLLEDYHAGTARHHDKHLFLLAPEAEVRHLLADWQPNDSYGVGEWGKTIAARFGIDAVPALIRHVQVSPGSAGVVLLPFVTPDVAAVMADWFARTRQARRWSIEWLARHRDQAAQVLIPAAAGKPGIARRNAETALRHLRGLGVDVEAIAEECGARTVIDVVLSVAPAEVLSSKLPVIGEWVDVRFLPQVLLLDRERVLSSEAVRHLLMTAALSKPSDLYAGLPMVRKALDPATLAAFAWAVFEQWQKAGAPPKESWALSALGWFGDDSTVRALSPLIRKWPGEEQHARAVIGLDVLADIGSGVALSHLNSIAEKAKFKGLKTRAREKVSQIADELALSRDQLADRLVPRLGLDDDASLVIDYGPRQFRVGFDQQLKPFVVDPDGKRRKDLPKPGAKDDPHMAPLEHKRYMVLKKDVRAVGNDQIHRLERAMVYQRSWTASEFHEILAAHPLLWHIVRRLVWTTTGGMSFRLAEDRTLADSRDDKFSLPENATVRVAHPIDLHDGIKAWGEVFADYEILQPFPQLGRPAHYLMPGEDLLTRLRKYRDEPHAVGRILGLTNRGWVRGQPQDGGLECWITRPFPGGGALVASLDPGIAVGAVDAFPEVEFAEFWYSVSGHGSCSPRQNGSVTAATDPITVSEVLSELESLRE